MYKPYKAFAPIIKLFFMFAFFVALGILAGVGIYLHALLGGFSGNFVVVSEDQKTNPMTTIELLFYIILGTIMIFVVSWLYKGRKLFLGLEVISFLIGGFILLYGVFLFFVPQPRAMEFAGLVAVAVALKRVINPPEVKNLIAGLTAGGMGAIFGISFSPFVILVFVLLLVLYDVISVFVTKHMVSLAKIVVERDLAFTISSSDEVPKNMPQDLVKKFGSDIRVDLGTGDLFVPIMFAVSTYAISPIMPVVVYVSSLVGFGVMMAMLLYMRRPLPALFPIMGTVLLFSVIFSFITRVPVF